MNTKFSRKQLEDALVGSKSIKDVLIALGLRVNNGQYRVVKGYFLAAGLELPRYVPPKVGVPFEKLTDEEFFVDGVGRSGQHIRGRLLARGVPFICDHCGLGPEWQGKPLTLQVDHIDGDRFNNLLENLHFLCPNCHAQTKSFGINNITRYRYCECGVRIGRKSTMCRQCNMVLFRRSGEGRTKIGWPDNEVLALMLQKESAVKVAKKLGVSDVAVRKHCIKHGVELPDGRKRPR